MWKRILSLLLSVVFFVFVPLLGGCEEKRQDKYSSEERVTAKDVPIGERIKQTGD